MASVGNPEPLEMTSGSPIPSSGKAKKSWSELRKAVRKSHRVASMVSGYTPHSFTFYRNPLASSTRLYFLGVPSGHRENTLFYIELPEHDDPLASEGDILEWQQLLDSFGSSQSQQLSKEEQLMHERKRLRSVGITAYDHCPAANKFAFSACSNLFVCEDQTPQGGFRVSHSS